jgi:hypothetical protein
LLIFLLPKQYSPQLDPVASDAISPEKLIEIWLDELQFIITPMALKNAV